MIQRLSRTLEVRRRTQTSIISVSATAASPELSADIANSIGEAYLDQQIEARLGSNQRAATFLRERTDGLAKEISDVEAKIESFVSSKMSEYGTPESKALLQQLERQALGRTENISTLMGLQSAMRADDYNRMAKIVDGALLSQRKELEALTGDPQSSQQALHHIETLNQNIRAAAERRLSDIQGQVTVAEKEEANLRFYLQPKKIMVKMQSWLTLFKKVMEALTYF